MWLSMSNQAQIVLVPALGFMIHSVELMERHMEIFACWSVRGANISLIWLWPTQENAKPRKIVLESALTWTSPNVELMERHMIILASWSVRGANISLIWLWPTQDNAKLRKIVVNVILGY